MLFAKSDTFSFLFPIRMPFISLSCLTALGRTFHTISYYNGENGHPCLVSYFRKKKCFSPLSILPESVSYMAYIWYFQVHIKVLSEVLHF